MFVSQPQNTNTMTMDIVGQAENQNTPSSNTQNAHCPSICVSVGKIADSLFYAGLASAKFVAACISGCA
jgi:hypothetical protein